MMRTLIGVLLWGVVMVAGCTAFHQVSPPNPPGNINIEIVKEQ